jgi:uncharacterized protein YndB with AHSA1/START domain
MRLAVHTERRGIRVHVLAIPITSTRDGTETEEGGKCSGLKRRRPRRQADRQRQKWTRARPGNDAAHTTEENIMADQVATAQIEINASSDRVWRALTEPEQIEKYMFGSRVETDWAQGSPIVWRGEYEGTKYEDKGEIVEIEPERRLKMTHFSPLSGQEDVPENYHTLLYELEEHGGQTRVSLSQDGNASQEEAEHSKSNWEKMLSGLKEVVEGVS